MAVCQPLRGILIITTGFTDLSAEAHRNQTAALLAASSALDTWGTPAGLTVSGGIHSGFFLSGGAGSLTGSVSPGRAIIPSASAPGGAYVVTMTEPEPVYFQPGDGTYTRRDLVILQIDDLPVVDPDAPVDPHAEPEYFPGASVKVLKGAGVTGTTDPQVPALPQNAIALWSVKILPTTTEATGYVVATTFDQRKRLLLANQDRQPFAMSAGILFNKPVRGQDSYAGPWGISFPAGRFRNTPIVTATIQNAPGGSATLVPRVINVTPTGASIYVYTGDGGPAGATGQVITLNVAWQAVQMAEDSSNG
jgi:hypothetical protein